MGLRRMVNCSKCGDNMSIGPMPEFGMCEGCLVNHYKALYKSFEAKAAESAKRVSELEELVVPNAKDMFRIIEDRIRSVRVEFDRLHTKAMTAVDAVASNAAEACERTSELSKRLNDLVCKDAKQKENTRFALKACGITALCLLGALTVFISFAVLTDPAMRTSLYDRVFSNQTRRE